MCSLDTIRVPHPVTRSSCWPTGAATQTCDRSRRAISSTMITKRCGIERILSPVYIQIRPWTMSLRARWWWPRRDSCWTFSWGKTSSTSLGSQACTSWRLDSGLNWSLRFQECLFPFGVAYALQKDSPYTKRCPLTFAINTISQGSAARFSSWRSLAL